MATGTDKRVYTAYREAGRCVMGWYAGYTLLGATIEADLVGGYGGKTVYDDEGWGDNGDIGVTFTEDSEHGLLVVNPDGTGRLPTDAEREHTRLTDRIVELDYRRQRLMVAAAGEAAGRIAEPQQVRPDHSRSERTEAYEMAPNELWDAWVVKAEAFLRHRAVWRRVRAVARGLLRRTTLYEQDITDAIRDDFEWIGDKSCP